VRTKDIRSRWQGAIWRYVRRKVEESGSEKMEKQGLVAAGLAKIAQSSKQGASQATTSAASVQ
jgi:hypothetical protein